MFLDFPLESQLAEKRMILSNIKIKKEMIGRRDYTDSVHCKPKRLATPLQSPSQKKIVVA
jgi:hypothetical protein